MASFSSGGCEIGFIIKKGGQEADGRLNMAL
jgi:hypothetical protein